MVATTNYHDISLVAIGCGSKKAPFDKKKTYKYTSSLNNKFRFIGQIKLKIYPTTFYHKHSQKSTTKGK